MESAGYPRNFSPKWLLGAALVSGAAAVSFGSFFLLFYWPYRGLFNDEGRYVDVRNAVVYHEQSGLLIVPTLAFLALALVFGAVWLVRRRVVDVAPRGP